MPGRVHGNQLKLGHSEVPRVCGSGYLCVMTKYSDTPAAIRTTNAYRSAKDALGYMQDTTVQRMASRTDLGPAQTQAVRDELRDRGLSAK